MSTYRQLTYEQRCQIEALKKSGLNQQAIADVIKVGQSTISRELSRNTGERGYRHIQAQRKTVERRQATVKPRKMTAELIDGVEDKLYRKWSPEQISGWLAIEEATTISHERIYQHVWSDKEEGGNLYKFLRRRAKRYQARGSNGKTSRGQIKNRVSNGKEFSEHERIAKKLDCGFYFAHPYHSWERGLNENTNGLLRQDFPKSTDFKRASDAAVKLAVEQLNDRPRKTLGFKTPAALMQEELAALAA